MTQKGILIDIGSSTIKAATAKSGHLQILAQKSILFKKDFEPELGISENSKSELFEFIRKIKVQNPDSRIKTFATALYRKMGMGARVRLIDEFYEKTNEFFNIID